MKICPTCQSTYADDSLTYCLVDGAILSTLRDPHETLRIPTPHNTDPAPTEILYPASKPAKAQPPLQPTIPASQQPYYPAPQSSQPQEKRGHSTGLLLGMGVLLGVVLAAVIAISFGLFSGSSSGDNRSESRVPQANASASSPLPKVTPTVALAELPGARWQECETYVTEICGEWSRSSSEQWSGQWGGVRADLTITVNGKDVTVKRRDLTESTKATYRGTLNTDNTQITGTVTWCCDTLGDRSGSWHAKLNDSQR